MYSIQFQQSRTVTWECALCKGRCTLAEEDFSEKRLTYGCHCGKIYAVIFDERITVEEDKSLETLFTIHRYSGGVEVCLAWESSKCRYASIDEEHGWSEALDRAIGYCWRMYNEEITAHIKGEEARD